MKISADDLFLSRMGVIDDIDVGEDEAIEDEDHLVIRERLLQNRLNEVEKREYDILEREKALITRKVSPYDRDNYQNTSFYQFMKLAWEKSRQGRLGDVLLEAFHLEFGEDWDEEEEEEEYVPNVYEGYEDEAQIVRERLRREVEESEPAEETRSVVQETINRVIEEEVNRRAARSWGDTNNPEDTWTTEREQNWDSYF